MSVPPLRLSNNFDSYISGEVSVHPSAILAPGVILQAAQNSKIIIGPGVCVGMGAILQVHEGTLEVEAGANLGAGFLMVGKGKIGANACIGSATTVINCSVQPGQVIPPGSILGDTSRQIEEIKQLESSPSNSTSTNAVEQPEKKVISSTRFWASPAVELKHQSTSFPQSATPENQSPPPPDFTSNGAVPKGETATASTEISENSLAREPPPKSSQNHNSDLSQPATESSDTFGTQIYGQGSIQRLLITLFPHRQSLNDQNSDNQSE